MGGLASRSIFCATPPRTGGSDTIARVYWIPCSGPPSDMYRTCMNAVLNVLNGNFVCTVSAGSYTVRYGTGTTTESITAPSSSLDKSTIERVWAGIFENVSVGRKRATPLITCVAGSISQSSLSVSIGGMASMDKVSGTVLIDRVMDAPTSIASCVTGWMTTLAFTGNDPALVVQVTLREPAGTGTISCATGSGSLVPSAVKRTAVASATISLSVSVSGDWRVTMKAASRPGLDASVPGDGTMKIWWTNC